MTSMLIIKLIATIVPIVAGGVWFYRNHRRQFVNPAWPATTMLFGVIAGLVWWAPAVVVPALAAVTVSIPLTIVAALGAGLFAAGCTFHKGVVIVGGILLLLIYAVAAWGLSWIAIPVAFLALVFAILHHFFGWRWVALITGLALVAAPLVAVLAPHGEPKQANGTFFSFVVGGNAEAKQAEKEAADKKAAADKAAAEKKAADEAKKKAADAAAQKAAAAKALKQSLTVKAGELLPNAAKCDATDVLSENSLKAVGVKHGRLWGDSPSTAFIAKGTGAKFRELLAEICTNPTLGDAYAQALSVGKPGGFSIAKANPWLKEFIAKGGSKKGLKTWLTHKVNHVDGKIITNSRNEPVIFVTTAYQRNAEKINALLLGLDNRGVKEDITSKSHWASKSLVADTLPRTHRVTAADQQENKPFLALTFTTKAGEECPFVLGVNIKDKRPEYLECRVARKVAPNAPTYTTRYTTTTSSTPGRTTTPRGGCTYKCNPSTPPKSNPKCPPGHWWNGRECLQKKDGSRVPRNAHHDPVRITPRTTRSPNATPANPATRPGSESTTPAQDSTPAPKATAAVPTANPSHTATNAEDKNPDD